MASLTQHLPSLLRRQHMQDHASAESLKPHWGYADQVVPCANDVPSCAYLEVVYDGHDYSVLFIGIMWAIFGGLLFLYAIGRRLIPSRRNLESGKEGETFSIRQHPVTRLTMALRASIRHYLLPESIRSIFGRTTRLQVVILLALTSYVTIVSFAGLTYGLWMTPVKNMEGVFRTRTTLGPWSNRVGVLAYALMPLSILLANRESLLSLLTGIPYQNFQFLHRWLGYIIFLQSTIHTIGWLIIELRLYQPQPQVWNAFMAETYAIWGIVAMIFIALIFVLSLPCSIRFTGYEVFRKVHYVMAMIFIGGCYGHWAPLGCFMIASLAVWGLDRIIRLVRAFLLHYQYLPESTSSMGFRSAQAQISFFEDEQNGDVVRLDFEHNHNAWAPGQHFYLCFPDSSIWQSHPFTPASLAGVGSGKISNTHTYVYRAQGGQTRQIAEIARAKTLEAAAPGSATSNDGKDLKTHEPNTSILPAALQSAPRSSTRSLKPTIPVILQGPYGTSHVDHIANTNDINILAIAGGSGVTFVLPILQYIITAPVLNASDDPVTRKIEFVWIVRRRSDVRWVQRELDTLRAASDRLNLQIRVYVTRDTLTDTDHTPADKHTTTDIRTGRETGSSTSLTSRDDEIHRGGSSSSSSSGANEKSAPRHHGRRFSITYHNTSSSSASPSSNNNPENSRARRHPDVGAMVRDFVAATAHGPTSVFASGPGGLVSDLRTAVAACNDGARVWRGDERAAVELVCDDRIDW
ncbi:hypothetical protein LTR84_000232 [Exophiala bonariae]|uniref:FAD-binding FR-type domain-containing protein n=1 Tax=Exophiala bonariae TaxID=1690606 RepID=A0AAV9NRR9_9EURO|nr:hypothetical protein LTR84_000232 [Exophiala bonariae]